MFRLICEICPVQAWFLTKQLEGVFIHTGVKELTNSMSASVKERIICTCNSYIWVDVIKIIRILRKIFSLSLLSASQCDWAKTLARAWIYCKPLNHHHLFIQNYHHHRRSTIMIGQRRWPWKSGPSDSTEAVTGALWQNSSLLEHWWSQYFVLLVQVWVKVIFCLDYCFGWYCI